MAAFDHMNTNERKKLAREEYLRFSSLLSALDERYQFLITLRASFSELHAEDEFARGLAPPFIIIPEQNSTIDTTSLNFLLRAQPSKMNEADINRIKHSAFNTANIRMLSGNFDYLLLLLKSRNDLYREIIQSTLDQHYTGHGFTEVSLRAFKHNNIPYARFTNFLHLTEQIVELADTLYTEYRGAIDELSKNSKLVIDEAIAKENYGYPSMHYDFENETDNPYIPLSITQLKLLGQRDYPNSVDYRQKFF
jgi:hypothetical protein